MLLVNAYLNFLIFNCIKLQEMSFNAEVIKHFIVVYKNLSWVNESEHRIYTLSVPTSRKDYAKTVLRSRI